MESETGPFLRFLADHYVWIKSFHVIGVIAWMAGMLYLPRLYVYHADAAPGSELSETLKTMERRLLRAIINPAMILAQDAGFIETDFLQAVGKDAEGVLTRSVFSLDLVAERPAVGRVNELFRRRAGKDLNDNTWRAFTGLLVLADAINRAGSTDPEAIRQALLATDLKPAELIMPWKGVRFDAATGQNELGTPIITQFRGGAFRVVWPFDLASTDVLYPLPKWSERP